eukprot:1518457-Pyramimonas_sp.AAC.1
MRLPLFAGCPPGNITRTITLASRAVKFYPSWRLASSGVDAPCPDERDLLVWKQARSSPNARMGARVRAR